jgi:hypothetical protein
MHLLLLLFFLRSGVTAFLATAFLSTAKPRTMRAMRWWSSSSPPPPPPPLLLLRASSSSAADIEAAERTVLDLLVNKKDGTQGSLVDALGVLEGSGQTIEASALEANWKLIYTSSSSFDYRSPLGRRADGTAPGLEKIFQTIFDGGGGGDGRAMASSSPIQRSVLSAPGIEATQDIFDLLSGKGGRVDQCVKAGPAFLKLSASATFDTSLGRVDFLFDEAYLLLGGAIRVPYPVPFRLLGDEARGYLDTSYVSKRLRVSRGNKGTTFVLVRGA